MGCHPIVAGASGSLSSSLSISKCVMLAAALFFGWDLCVRGGSEEKEGGAEVAEEIP